MVYTSEAWIWLNMYFTDTVGASLGWDIVFFFFSSHIK